MLSLVTAALLLVSVEAQTPVSALLKYLSPPLAQFPSPSYDGYEIRVKNFVFRPALFKMEGLALLGVLAYVALSLVGGYLNKQKANKWFEAHRPVLESQFSRPHNVSTPQADGHSDFFYVSTGRRGLHTLYTIITLRPRHDIFQMIYQFAWGLAELTYAPKDDILLDFKLRDKAGVNNEGKGFVWAIVAKDEMRSLRKDRWDLSFTKTSENPAVSTSLTVMSEIADITDVLLKSPASKKLCALLRDPVVVKHIRSLIITDQVPERPELGPIPAAKRERHILLSLIAPSPSTVHETVPLVKEIFTLVDMLSGPSPLKIETIKKLKKTRVELDEELTKEFEKEAKEEAEAEKIAAKRKADEEKTAKMSPAEQKKAEEKERKKSMKKSAAKMMKR